MSSTVDASRWPLIASDEATLGALASVRAEGGEPSELAFDTIEKVLAGDLTYSEARDILMSHARESGSK